MNRLVTAIKLANLKIHEEAQRNPACQGMGTTVVATCSPRTRSSWGTWATAACTACATGGSSS